MKPRFPHTGAEADAPEFGRPPLDESLPTSPARREDRACCCPAQPVVRVIMPPTAHRQHPVDLLLCGHHYRVSHRALAVAGARIDDLPGKAGAASAALLLPEGAQRDHADVSGR
jgi:hypothetical protein